MSAPSRIDDRQLESLLRTHFNRPDEGRCPRESDLARYAANDLTPEERQEFTAHLGSCMDCKTDLQRFDLDAREHALEAKPSTLRALAQAVFHPRQLRWAGLGTAMALVALVLVRQPTPPDSLQPKGAAPFQLHVAATREGRTFRVQPEARPAPGDKLGFFYSAPDEGQLMVVYANERELVRVFPSGEARSAAVAPGSELPLSDGAVLSPEKGCEWIVGLHSKRPFDESEAATLVKGIVARRQGCQLPNAASPDLHLSVVEVTP